MLRLLEKECRRTLGARWFKSYHLICMAALQTSLNVKEKWCIILLKPIGADVVIIIIFCLFYAVESNTNTCLFSCLGKGGGQLFILWLMDVTKKKTPSNFSLAFLQPSHVSSCGLSAHCQVGWTWISITDSPWDMTGAEIQKAKYLAPCPKQATGKIQVPWPFPQGILGIPGNHNGTIRPGNEVPQGVKVKPCSPIHSGVCQGQDWGEARTCLLLDAVPSWHDPPTHTHRPSILIWDPALGCVARLLSKQPHSPKSEPHSPKSVLKRKWYRGKTQGCNLRPTWVPILFLFLSYVTSGNFFLSASFPPLKHGMLWKGSWQD